MKVRNSGRSLFFDLECISLPFFQMIRRSFRNVGEDGEWSQLLGLYSINEKSSFTVKVIKTKKRGIGIGVIDANEKKKRSTDFDQKNIIFYNGWNKTVLADGEWVKKHGSGFGEGQIVRVSVDVKEGKICWEVDGKR